MKTFTVPVFLGVIAESSEDAIEKAQWLLESTYMRSSIFPYCDIGLEHEVIEQEELK